MAVDTYESGAVTSDILLHAGQARVEHILVSCGATGGTWELNDSTDDSGNDKIGGFAPPNTVTPIPLPNGLNFLTAVWVDIQPGTNVYISVRYTER